MPLTEGDKHHRGVGPPMIVGGLGLAGDTRGGGGGGSGVPATPGTIVRDHSHVMSAMGGENQILILISCVTVTVTKGEGVKKSKTSVDIQVHKADGTPLADITCKWYLIRLMVQYGRSYSPLPKATATYAPFRSNRRPASSYSRTLSLATFGSALVSPTWSGT